MDDDFNTAGGLGALSGLFALMNELVDKPPVKDKALIAMVVPRDQVRQIGKVVGILFEWTPPPESAAAQARPGGEGAEAATPVSKVKGETQSHQPPE